MAFIGEGVITRAHLHASTGYVCYTVRDIVSWKVEAPREVRSRCWPAGASFGEGQRVVFAALEAARSEKPRVVYVTPVQVLRLSSRDCFSFTFGNDVMVPEATLRIRWQPPFTKHGPVPIVLLEEFRAAVRSAANDKGADLKGTTVTPPAR